MKIIHRAICFGIAAALALPVATTAMAQDGMSTIQLLSQASGLTVRQVQMVLGNRSTTFAEYRTSYDLVDQRFNKAVGPEIYQSLKERGELSKSHMQALTAMAQVRANAELASK